MFKEQVAKFGAVCCLCDRWVEETIPANKTIQEKVMTVQGDDLFIDVCLEILNKTCHIADVDVDKINFKEVRFCSNCRSSLLKGEIPKLYVLNWMGLDLVLDEIMCLNIYEKILTQRAKAFFNVFKLKVMSCFQGNRMPAVKGTCAHLPLLYL